MSSGPDLSGGEWGWIVAIAATTWGAVLRYVIGHYVAVAKQQKIIAERIESRLGAIEVRLARIEGRSNHRRKGD
jgi:hypothetical protein